MHRNFYVFLVLGLLFGVSACRVQNNPPELTSVAPAEVQVGQEITLAGYQFGQAPVVLLQSDGAPTPATIVSQDDNRIRAKVPIINPGRTLVRVQTDEGTSDPLPVLVVQPGPSLTALSPTNGLPGTVVVLTGNYLNQIQRIRFHTVDAVIQDSTAERVTVVVPSNVPRGPLQLVVETKGGQVAQEFIVAGTPTITAITPKAAPPGSQLVIQGTNLSDGVVRINGLGTDRNQTVIKDTEIRTVIPENAQSGLVTVTVFERLVATSTDSLKIVQPPALASLGALDGAAGEKLILTGLNLSAVQTVRFGTTTAPFRVLSDTQLETTVPALPNSGPVTLSVSSVGGTGSASQSFFFLLPPSGVTFSPARQARSSPITIMGQNLYRITEVRVSGQLVPVTERVEGVSLLVQVPPDAVSGFVTVTNRAGSATSTQSLTIVLKPVVTTLVPAKARPGERLTLRGEYLLNAQVFFVGSPTAAADGGTNGETERSVIVPADAQTGAIKVVNVAGEMFTTQLFTVLRPVTNLAFTPATAKPGESIVITGQNMASITEIRFGNGTSSPAQFAAEGDQNRLRVYVPANATTGQICLTNDLGTYCTGANFTVAK